MPQDVALSGMEGVQWAQLELTGLRSGWLTHRESSAQIYSCFSMEQSSRKSAEREQQRGSSAELMMLRQMILLQQDGINRNGVWSGGRGTSQGTTEEVQTRTPLCSSRAREQ